MSDTAVSDTPDTSSHVPVCAGRPPPGRQPWDRHPQAFRHTLLDTALAISCSERLVVRAGFVAAQDWVLGSSLVLGCGTSFVVFGSGCRPGFFGASFYKLDVILVCGEKEEADVIRVCTTPRLSVLLSLFSLSGLQKMRHNYLPTKAAELRRRRPMSERHFLGVRCVAGQIAK